MKKNNNNNTIKLYNNKFIIKNFFFSFLKKNDSIPKLYDIIYIKMNKRECCRLSTNKKANVSPSVDEKWPPIKCRQIYSISKII